MPAVCVNPETRRSPAFSRYAVYGLERQSAEFDQSRLIRLQFQAEPDEPFPKLLEETLGVGSVLKGQHNLVGIPDHNCVCPLPLSCAKLDFTLLETLSHFEQNELVSRLCLCLLNYPGRKLQNGMCGPA
jgi:hypothetical protein